MYSSTVRPQISPRRSRNPARGRSRPKNWPELRFIRRGPILLALAGVPLDRQAGFLLQLTKPRKPLRWRHLTDPVLEAPHVIDLSFVAPPLRLTIAQPERSRLSIGRVALGIGRVNRRFRSRRHEDFDRLMLISEAAMVEVFRHVRVCLNASAF